MKHLTRIAIYIAGLFILAFGINLSIISDLGVTPLVSLQVAISLLVDKSLGLTTFFIYLFYVAIQWILLKKDFRLKDTLQVLFGVVFSYFVDFTATLMTWVQADHYLMQLFLTFAGLVFIAIGVVMVLSMDIVPNAPDGLTATIAKVTGSTFSRIKVLFDCTSVVLSIIVGLVFLDSISYIREGTIIAALLTGSFIGFFSKLLTAKLKKYVFKADQSSVSKAA